MNWLQIAISFVTGSLAATVIRIYWDTFSARRQPVEFVVSTDPVFNKLPQKSGLQAEVQVSHEGQTFWFDAISVIRIDMTNTGNRDVGSFDFGVTLAQGHAVVSCDVQSADRHHRIQESEPRATPAQPREELDFKCTPFNRGDSYTVTLLVKNSGEVEDEHITVSTAAALRLTRSKPLRIKYRRADLLAAVTMLIVGLYAFGYGRNLANKDPAAQQPRYYLPHLHEGDRFVVRNGKIEWVDRGKPNSPDANATD